MKIGSTESEFHANMQERSSFFFIQVENQKSRRGDNLMIQQNSNRTHKHSLGLEYENFLQGQIKLS